MVVNIDFESRSMADLKKVGLYQYACHPSTQILMAAYKIDDAPIKLWTIGQPVPQELIDAVDLGFELHAWNAQFERVMWMHCWGRRGGPLYGNIPDFDQWHCSMARGALYGLPLSLAQAADALKLPEAKDMGGRRLMLQMTKPRTVEKGRPTWWEDEERMRALGVYCMNDVRVEIAIDKKLKEMPAKERKIFLLDQKINDRGIRLDCSLAHASREVAEVALKRADQEIRSITAGAVKTANQVSALGRWVKEQGVLLPDGLTANAIAELLQKTLPLPVRQALEVRQAAAKSSVAKLESMQLYAGAGDRLRGLLQYSGAATGRWAGRGPQPHNFPRGTMNDVEDIIPLVLSGDIDAINLYAPVLETLSNLLRAHLIAAQGHVLLAGDYAAIEARVLAWLAGQEDLLEMFRQGQDPYKAMAAKVYKVAASEVDKRQRQMGKVAVLGLGYQMGKKTFRTTCANWGMFVEEPFAADVVKVYRDANPEIVRLWEVLDAGARKAVRNPGTYFKGPKIDFVCRDGWLEMILPSGRSLYYAEPKLVRVPTPWDEKELREVIECWFYSSYTHQWTQRKMYGGLWVENAVQAISRDILAESMLALEADGYPIVLTVHDEIVAEIPADYIKGRLARFVELMKRAPAWAEGCPIEVEAWAGKRYKK